MNFLRNSFSTIADPPPPIPRSDGDRDPRLLLHQSVLPASAPAPAPAPAPPASSSSLPPPHLSSTPLAYFLDSDFDDPRSPSPSAPAPPPLPPPSAADSLRTRNKVPIEDHLDVTEENGGGVLVPSRELPDDWHRVGQMASIMDLDRSFLFPGESIDIVLHVCSHGDSKHPEIITPFRVAAAMDKARLTREETETNKDTVVGNESLERDNAEDEMKLHKGNVKGTSCVNSLWIEEEKKRSMELLHLFQNSHFFTRILEAEDAIGLKSGPSGEDGDDGAASINSSEHRRSTESSQPLSILMERGGFDPRYAGGVARNARCYSFDNDIIAVVLQITVGVNLKNDVILEVLQFEKPSEVEKDSDHMVTETSTLLHQSQSDSSADLLQWLLPLENLSHMSFQGVQTVSNSFVNSSPQKPSSSGSTLFSFASMKSYSAGSSTASQVSTTASSQFLAATGLSDAESPKPPKGQPMGNEGLIAFRGIQLEPQRFSVHCGLEGLYVPGRRWRRKLQVVEPVLIESYFADCNTKDLICVSIENVVPDHLPEVLVTIDSISIVCETTDPSRTTSPVPIACIEVGENHKLPGASLRPGEQHSFVLKPSNSPLHSTVLNTIRPGSTSSLHNTEVQTTRTSYYSSDKKKANEQKLVSGQELENYVVLVSCRCNHSASRLHFKHPIKWKPRPPRDLLMSVSLQSGTESVISEGMLPSLVPKVVTVQATNLTSESLHLTLLTPSSKYLGPSGSVPVSNSSGLSRINSFMSFRERKEWPNTKIKDDILESEKINAEPPANTRPSSLQRSLSLPPARPIESIMGITPRVVKERAISAADIAAENISVRTHLLLQSIIPLGSVPAQATTAIRCELLPLTDGIITLDTLHISTRGGEIYYPERPLQVYATSSISLGIP